MSGWVAGAVAVAGLGGAYISSQGAKSAASTQANAANAQQAAVLAAGQQASGIDLNAIGQTQQYLQPYSQLGSTAAGIMQNDLTSGALTQGFNPTMAQLQSMPGYQFQLQQGIEAMQNGFAGRGLASSGAAMKGAGQFAQGLASGDMNNLANIYYTNQNNLYNRLMGNVGVGANAASNQAQINQNLTQAGANAVMGSATNAANLGMAGAAASAAGQVGSANAIAGGLTNAGNTIAQYSMLNNLLNPPTAAAGMYGGSGGVMYMPGGGGVNLG